MRVLALDPARTSDGFGLAVVELWGDVALVTHATTLPRGLDQPTQIGIALDYIRRMEHYGAPVDWLIGDARGLGVGITDGLRAELEPKFAKGRTIAFHVGSGYSPKVSKTKNRDTDYYHMWSMPKNLLVERVAAEIIHGRLVLSEHMEGSDLTTLKRQFARFQKQTTPTGKETFAAPGRNSDDVLTSVLMAELVILENKRKGGPSSLSHPSIKK